MHLTWRAPAAMALCALAVLAVPSLWVVLAWVVVLVAIIAVDVVAAPDARTLTWRREPLGAVHLGEETTSVLSFTNTGTRRMRGRIRDAWLPGAGPRTDPTAESEPFALEPGNSARVEVPLRPTRRGFRRTDRVTVRALGPLGFAGRQRSFDVPGVVQVLPTFGSRRHLPSRVVQLQEIDGASQVRTFGRGNEFDSLREYVRGDDVRSIDWRATARSREPIVRTWRPERDRQVVIVLDTSRLSAGRLDDTTRLDAGMDACLLLAALASHAGDEVVWLAADRDVVPEVRAERTHHQGVVRRILVAMAPIEPRLLEPNWRTTLRRVATLSRRGGLVVLVTPFDPAAVEEGLLPLLPALAREHRVVIASVADPEIERMQHRRDDVRSVYDAAAAERHTFREEQLRGAVERLGVDVLHLDPEHLPPAVADRYLQLKRDGLL